MLQVVALINVELIPKKATSIESNDKLEEDIFGGNHKVDLYDRRIFECRQQNVEIDGRKNT